jgi:hypothetical protein
MSLNKFLNVDTGKALELNIGCLNMEVENNFVCEGEAFIDTLDIGDLKAEILIIEGNVDAVTADITNRMTADFLEVDNVLSTNNLDVRNEMKLGSVVIKPTIGNVGDVLTSNGANEWEMAPLLPPSSYGYAITNVEVKAVDLVDSGGLNDYTNAVAESDAKDVSAPILPPDFYALQSNGIETKEAGFYRVNGYILVEFTEPNHNLHMTILRNGSRPNNNKEVFNLMRNLTNEAFYFSEVVGCNDGDVVSLGLAKSGSGTAPEANIKSWKLSIVKVY